MLITRATYVLLNLFREDNIWKHNYDEGVLSSVQTGKHEQIFFPL